jgi:hypothetical protein
LLIPWRNLAILEGLKPSMTKSIILAIVAIVAASPAAAATYACQFKGKPLMLIDTTYQHERLTVGKQSVDLQAGNGFWTADIDDEEYIFRPGMRGPDDQTIRVGLDMGAYHADAVCVRR